MPLDITWNWDQRLRSAATGGDSIACRYAPDGSRVYREQTVDSVTTRRKYIVDAAGAFPRVLLELDPNDNFAVKKSYLWADDELIAQYDGAMEAGSGAAKYFYLHDRLGSVRMVLDEAGSVVRQYTYDSYGNELEHASAPTAPDNPFTFAGYIWDDVIRQFYLHARWYDPELALFTGRDPVIGNFREPLTLHVYLYCLNDPINNIDPSGKSFLDSLFATSWGARMYAAAASAGSVVMRYAQAVVNQLVAARNFITNLAIRGGDKGLELAMRLGKQGEMTAQNLLNFIKNTQRFYTSAGNYRIPDGVVGKMFLEVKNVAYLSLNAQIKDLVEIAHANGGMLTIIVRVGTTLSGPLQSLVDNGTIQVLEIL